MDFFAGRSRFCALAVSPTTIAVLGGERTNDNGEEVMATSDMLTYSSDDGEWISQPAMFQARKDHACLMAEIDGDKGVLVTGGVDADDLLLDSVEFYSLQNEAWAELRPMKRPRTEHGMNFGLDREHAKLRTIASKFNLALSKSASSCARIA